MSYIPTSAVPDKSTFTEGTTPVVPVGGEWNDGSAALTSGQVAGFRITEKRAAHVNLRSETGTEMGTAANPLTISDATLAAIVSGGKAQVQDALAEASLGTLAGAIASGKMQVSDVALDALIASGALKTADQNLAGTIASGKVLVSDALLEALIQGTRLAVEVGGANAYARGVFTGSQTLPSYGASATVLIPAVAGKWIKVYAIQLQFDPNTYATTAAYNDLVFQEGTSGSLIVWDTPFYIPGPASNYTPLTLSQGLNLFTPPGFNYVTTVSGASINYGATAGCTLGTSSGLVVIYAWYRYLSSTPL